MENEQNPRQASDSGSGTMKRFYRRGKHPNSRKNLKPVKKGECRNPAGRGGARTIDNQLKDIFFGGEWKEFLRETRRTHRLLDAAFKKEFGLTVDQMWDRMEEVNHGRHTAKVQH